MAEADAPLPAGGILAVREKAALPKVLRRFDLVLSTACAVRPGTARRAP